MLLSVSCFPHWGLQKQLLFGLRLPLQSLSWHAAASAPASQPLPSSLPLAPGRQDHRAVSTPVNLGAPLLLLFLPGMSFSAGEGAVGQGEGDGVVQWPSTNMPAASRPRPTWPCVQWFYKAETLTTLLAMAGMFVLGPGLAGGGRLSPSGVSAGGVGMLMMAVVIWDVLQFGLSPSSAFRLRLERLG